MATITAERAATPTATMSTAMRRPSVPRGVAAPVQRRRALTVRFAIATGFVVVLLMWWLDTSVSVVSPAQLATSIGELSGMLGGYLVCAQVLLIARVPWFEDAVGLDKLVRWHRTLGTTVVLLILTHVVFMILGGMILLHTTPWAEVFVILRSYPDMLAAFIGTVAFLAVGFTSARLLRRYLSYEAWYWVHVTIYAGIFLTFLHQLSAGVHFVNSPINRLAWLILYLGTAAAVLTWRVILPLTAAWRHRLRVDGVVA